MTLVQCGYIKITCINTIENVCRKETNNWKDKRKTRRKAGYKIQETVRV